jgi:hypothetical protein
MTNFKTIPNISYKNIYNNKIKELNLLESSKFIYNNNLYIWGGYKNNSNIYCNNNIYKLNLLDNSITILNKIPEDCATTHVKLTLLNDNILIISGQIGGIWGEATDSFYIYNITNNIFIKNNNLPFKLYSVIPIINKDKLIIFSGSKSDRVTPNTDIWYCDIIDNNGNIIFNPLWNKNNNFVGTNHSSIINNNNENYYFGGCGCHTCSYYNIEQHIYCHDGDNYKITFDKNNEFITKKISKQIFKTSHTESSTFIKDNIIYSIGGQLTYDDIYNGCQLYFIDLDLWMELTISKEYLKYFTKGCICFENNNKLYLTSGQFKTNMSIFNDDFLIFELDY